MAVSAPPICFFFTECVPVHGDLIHYGPTHSKEEANLGHLSEATNFGRWDDDLGVIIGPDLRPFVLKGRRGYCWQPAGRRLLNAELMPVD